jgi:hypothetical protein
MLRHAVGRAMNSDPGIEEKRRAKRYPFTVVVTIQELSAGQKISENSPAIGCVSRNASESGICLSTAVPLPYSAVVRCDISVGDLRITIPTMAQVRWVQKGHAGEYRSGLAYIF